MNDNVETIPAMNTADSMPTATDAPAAVAAPAETPVAPARKTTPRRLPGLKTPPADLNQAALRELFWNLDGSDLARDAARRIDALLAIAESTPPFLTNLDVPLAEAV